MSADPSNFPTPPAGRDSPGSQRADRPVAAGQLVPNPELAEFMGRLGLLKHSSAEPVEETPGPRRSVRPVIAAALVLILLLGKGTFWSWWSDSGPIPNQLLGAWKTSSDRFKDRGFVIMRDSLQLRLGERQSVTYPIARMRSGGGVDQNLFTFDYRDESNLELQLSLYMKSDSVVYLANLPDVVWTKESR